MSATVALNNISSSPFDKNSASNTMKGGNVALVATKFISSEEDDSHVLSSTEDIEIEEEIINDEDREMLLEEEQMMLEEAAEEEDDAAALVHFMDSSTASPVHVEWSAEEGTETNNNEQQTYISVPESKGDNFGVDKEVKEVRNDSSCHNNLTLIGVEEPANNGESDEQQANSLDIDIPDNVLTEKTPKKSNAAGTNDSNSTGKETQTEGNTNVPNESENTESNQIQPGRRRVWSIDLGRFLDFDDTSMAEVTAHDESDLPKSSDLPPLSLSQVAMANPAPSQGCSKEDQESRCNSADSQAVTATEQNNSIAPHEENEVDLAVLDSGRDRGLSFEIFSFGINEHEPIPDGCTSEGNGADKSARPRGDSIFFEQFGESVGLQEENLLTSELARRRGYSISSLLGEEEERAIINDPSFSNASFSMSKTNKSSDVMQESHHPGYGLLENYHDPTADNNAHSSNHASNIPALQQHQQSYPPHMNSTSLQYSTINPTPQATSIGEHLSSAAAIAALQQSCPMDLLNKGGRIGIYLPEQRKARIAQFHSKRKLRIWRKRIKYDCRKKLADSRPRIKGRFVKRSDVEEE